MKDEWYTWGEIKRVIDEHISDDTPIRNIEIAGFRARKMNLVFDYDEDGSVLIW